MKKSLKESPKVLGLDVSTRTIGWALFDIRLNPKRKIKLKNSF